MNELDFPLSLGFEDVAIQQNKNICNSRLDANIRSEVIKGVFLDIPLIAANMSTVTNADFCIKLSKLGAMGILHRAASEQWILTELSKMKEQCQWVAGSIGIGQGQLELATKMIKAGCNIIVIDIAHGYCDPVLNLGKELKNKFSDIKIVLGNTTNIHMLVEGKFADAIKVGLSNGLVCTTKNTAGCMEKQFSAVYKFKFMADNIGMPIISDGGIREQSDFVKAIAAGANSVMAGSIFAACPESAAEIENINDISKKVYSGMSSEVVQNKWRNGLKKGTCAEGIMKYLDIGKPVAELIENYAGALRSGITYGGGNDIITFKEKVRFVRFK